MHSIQKMTHVNLLKMYLLFSEEEDRQTNEIIDRLLYYDKEVSRYNNQFTEDEKKELLEVLSNQRMLAGQIGK